jgi:hypothetical protein
VTDSQKKVSSDICINFAINEFTIKVTSTTLNCEVDGRGSLIFEMKNLSTQVILENEFKDTAIDLSVKHLQIRTASESDPTQDDDIFRKVLSCPLDDVCSDYEILKLVSCKTLEKDKKDKSQNE